MNEDFRKKIEKFSFLIVNYKTYQEQLENSFDNKIFDFSIILFWKLFMLFVYERLQQIRYFLEEDIFEQKWKTIFKAEKYDLIRYDKRNLYSYNQLEDEEIINLLNLLYPIDSNFLKKLKNLKQDRHTAGHVCDPTLTNQENDVLNFIREILVIFEKLQLEHEKNYLTQIELSKFVEGEVNVSGADKKFLTYRAIESLPIIPNFNSAKLPLEFIEKNLPLIPLEKKKEIIINSLKNGGLYNQVIESGYGPIFFKKLFEDGDLNIDDWKNFYIDMTIANQGNELTNYLWLKEELIKKEINIENEIIRKKEEIYSVF